MKATTKQIELLKKLHRFNMELIGNLPLMWKTCLILAGIFFLEVIEPSQHCAAPLAEKGQGQQGHT